MSTRPIPGARHRAARSAARIVVLGLVAAAVAGVASAAFGRLIMRSFTLVAGGTPAFSWAGTVAITLVYVVAMTPRAIASVATRRWPRALLLGAGAPLLALASVNIGLQEDVDNATSTPARTLASVALVAAFAGGIAAQVWLLVGLGDRLRRSSADHGGSSERSQPRRPPSQGRWSTEMLPQ